MDPATPALPRNCSFKESEWRVLSGFWHPVAFSTAVTDRPIPARLLDENLVVFRTSQGVTVARDLCLHRGARLSQGAVDQDQLVCGFHGFHYNAAGQCTRIPAHPGIPISRKLCLTIYPSVERYGLIWTCLAGSAVAPLPEWPEIEGGKYDVIPMDPVDWNASAGRHTENFNDVAHLSWVHTKTFGSRETPEVIRYAVKDEGTRLSIVIPRATQHDRDIYGKQPDQISTVRYVQEVDLPFASKLLVDYFENRHLLFFDVASPVSARSCRIFALIGRNMWLDEPAKAMIDYNLAILAEDKPFVEGQCPQDLPLDLRDETHIPADLLSVEYRKRLKKYGMGEEFYA
jgi:vanillate O-demethylase monooxygenase subunit